MAEEKPLTLNCKLRIVNCGIKKELKTSSCGLRISDCGLKRPEFSPRCLGRGPGARALRAESIGRVGPFPRGSARLPQKTAGPRATRRVAPTGFQPKDVALGLCPPVPWNQRGLMVSARKALTPGPGNRGKATFRWWPLVFRFERFPVSQASGSARGQDCQGKTMGL